MFKIIFRGQYHSHLSEEEACQRLAQIYKTNDLTLFSTWFTGQDITIKSDISKQEAIQYQQYFKQMGLMTDIEQIKPAPLFALEPTPVTPSNPSYSPNHYPQETLFNADEYEYTEESETLTFAEKFKWAFLSIHGRLNRLDFFFFLLLYMLISAIIFFSVHTLIQLMDIQSLNLIYTPIQLVLFCIYTILTTKRLHDLGYSGWIQAGFYLAIIVLLFYASSSIFGFFTLQGNANDIIAYVWQSFVKYYWFMIGMQVAWLIFLSLAGQNDDNPYGDIPAPSTNLFKIGGIISMVIHYAFMFFLLILPFIIEQFFITLFQR